MFFVWTSWWIVLAVLFIGIIATAVIFIVMDRKDRVIIEEFKKQHSENAEQVSEPSNK